jgi:hypothetical protein
MATNFRFDRAFDRTGAGEVECAGLQTRPAGRTQLGGLMRRVWQSLYLWGLKPLRVVGPEGRAWAARAARGSKRARLAWWALVLVVGSGLFAGLAVAGAWMVHWRLWEYHPDSLETVLDDLGDDEYLWSYVTAWAIAAGITLVALVVMRPDLRGGRVASALRDREAGAGPEGSPRNRWTSLAFPLLPQMPQKAHLHRPSDPSVLLVL